MRESFSAYVLWQWFGTARAPKLCAAQESVSRSREKETMTKKSAVKKGSKLGSVKPLSRPHK
jgi:hypothetical protein